MIRLERQRRGVVVDAAGEVPALLANAAAQVETLRIPRVGGDDRGGVLGGREVVLEIEVQLGPPQLILRGVRRVRGDGRGEVLERGVAIAAIGVAAGPHAR